MYENAKEFLLFWKIYNFDLVSGYNYLCCWFYRNVPVGSTQHFIKRHFSKSILFSRSENLINPSWKTSHPWQIAQDCSLESETLDWVVQFKLLIEFGGIFGNAHFTYRVGSRFRVNETSEISERYSVQMKAVTKQKICFVRCTSQWLNAQNMTGTQHLATKGCATALLRPELSSWTYYIVFQLNIKLGI